MKKLSLICCIATLALISLSCTPEATLEVAVAEADDGAVIENVGSVDCIVFVMSAHSDQRFELAANETVTVTDVSQPIEVSAVSLANRT